METHASTPRRRTWLRRIRYAAIPAALATVAGLALVPDIQRASAAETPSPTPSVYVVTNGDGNLAPFTTAGVARATRTVGGDPVAIAVTPNGKRAYVVKRGSSSVVSLNLTTSPATIEKEIAVGSNPVAVAITADGTKALVLNNGSGTITPISTSNNAADTPIIVGPDPRAIAINPDGTKAYVTVGSVDLVTVTLLDRRVAPPIKVGPNPQGVAITPNGAVVYVVTKDDNSVSLLYDDKLVKTVPVGSAPERIAISGDGRHAIVTSSSTPTITDLDLVASGDVAGTSSDIAVDGIPSDVTIEPNGADAWVVSSSSGSLTPVNLGNDAPGTAITGLDKPIAVVASPDQPVKAAVAVTGSPTVACPAPPPSGVTAQACVPEGGSVHFDASASVPNTTPAATYVWDFGDGSEPATGATVDHSYEAAGSYLPTVTVTTTEGTSTLRAFTGQTVSRNGSSVAVATASVRVVAAGGVSLASPLIYVTGLDGKVTPILAVPGTTPKKLNSFTMGRAPAFPAVAPSGRAIVTPDIVDGSVYATAVCGSTSGISFTPGNSIAAGVRPYRVAIAPTPSSSSATSDVYAVYVTDSGAPVVRRFDLTIEKDPCRATLSAPPASAIAMPGNPSAIAITADGTKAYVAVSSLNVIVPIRLDAGVPLNAIPVGTSPTALTITPRVQNYVVLVANSGSNNVTPIFNDTALPAVQVGATPQDIAFEPDGAKAYVTNSGGTTVTPVIMPSGSTVNVTAGTPIDVGVVPTGITVSPDGATLWVSSYVANAAVPVNISEATPTVGTRITGIRTAIGIVATPDQPPIADVSLTSPEETQCTLPLPVGVADQLCANAGAVVSVNVAGTVPLTTAVAKYDVRFGDGTELLDQPAETTTVEHQYQYPGTFIVSVTATDTAGTSTLQVFTGQTVSRNGNSAAIAYGIVRMTAAPTPAGVPLIYVANGVADTVTPVATPADSAPLVGNAFDGGRLPVFPDVTPDGRAIVTPNSTTGEITATAVCVNGDSLTFKRGNSMVTGVQPNWVAISPKAITNGPDASSWNVYVVDTGGNDIRQFVLNVVKTGEGCTATLTLPPIGGIIPVGPRPYGLVISPDGRFGYATVGGIGAVVQIDLMTNHVVGKIDVGPEPRGIAITHAATPTSAATIYVAVRGDGTPGSAKVAKFAVGETSATSVVVGGAPGSIAIDPTNAYALVTNDVGTTATPISLGGFTAGTPVQLGVVPTAVAFAANSSTAYISSYDANSLVLVTAGSWTVGQAIRGISSPTGIVSSAGQS